MNWLGIKTVSRELNELDPSIEEKVREILQNLRQQGYEMHPFCTKRNVVEQAKLWRQSRTTKEIKLEIRRLKNSGGDFLAQCIEYVGPQHGRWATNAIPGMSWHNWGLAVDCFLADVEGRALWNLDDDYTYNGYQAYAEAAVNEGFIAGFFWRNRDAVHIQSPSQSVISRYDLATVNDKMKQQYGDIIHD